MDLNELFQEFAEAFVGRVTGDGDIAFPAKLKRGKLDFSLESLREVDTYLAYLRKHRQKASSQEMNNALLWGGAYVGEVIRRIAKRSYEWTEHADFIAANPRLEQVIPLTFGTQVLLLAEDGSMTLPINKLVRFLEEGPENSVHFYAGGER